MTARTSSFVQFKYDFSVFIIGVDDEILKINKFSQMTHVVYSLTYKRWGIYFGIVNVKNSFVSYLWDSSRS